MPLWIFTGPKGFPPAVFYGFHDEVYEFIGFHVHYKQSTIQFFRNISSAFLQSFHATATFFPFRFGVLEEVLINLVIQFFLVLLSHSFCFLWRTNE